MQLKSRHWCSVLLFLIGWRRLFISFCHPSQSQNCIDNLISLLYVPNLDSFHNSSYHLGFWILIRKLLILHAKRNWKQVLMLGALHSLVHIKQELTLFGILFVYTASRLLIPISMEIINLICLFFTYKLGCNIIEVDALSFSQIQMTLLLSCLACCKYPMLCMEMLLRPNVRYFGM